ncbi:glutamate racemase [Candidatus Omnitrophota bacterium]
MKSPVDRPIGIFDSGLGGLTVARSIRRHLPEEDIIYFGDTARVPYGNKSRSTITRFAREIMAFMVKNKVKMVVVACNTASSLSLAFLKKNYSIPIIGVIRPGIKEAVNISRNKRIGVIGTNSTISSGAYDRELKKLDPSYRLFSKCCPLFVPLVENKLLNDTVTYQMARRYLEGFRAKRIDTLVMGCTHYPLLKTVIAKVLRGVKLVDSSFAVAKEAKETLVKKELGACCKKGGGKMKCFVSDDVKGFRNVAGMFLKEKISVKKVVL